MAISITGIRRILMTTDTVGGVWTYSLELIRALKDWHIEVVLATMGRPLTPDQRLSVLDLDNVDLYESSYRLEWMQNPWPDVKAAGRWLLSLEERTRPDIIHLNNYAHGDLPWRAPVVIVGHSCVFSWFAAVKGTAPPREWDRYHREIRQGLAAADRVTAPTQAMLRSLNAHYGEFNDTKPIYNARRPEDFPPQWKRAMVLTAGRLWDEAKNAAALEEIAPRLAWPVMMAGDCEHPAGGSRRLRSIRYLGQLTPRSMAIWMGRAAIFALPARYEPFGLSALEAALAGCALVLGDIPSLREVWGDAAVYVPPDNPAALLDVLKKLIATPPWRSHLASRARKRALFFTPERMVRQYMVLYTSLLRQQQALPAPPETGLKPEPKQAGKT